MSARSVALAGIAALAMATTLTAAGGVTGGRLAFVTATGVHTSNAAGSGLTLLKERECPPAALPCIGPGVPRWSRDGARLAFVDYALVDGLRVARLHVLNADGSGRRLIAAGVGIGLSDQPWSPDGGRIAFTQLESGAPAGTNAEVYVGDVLDDGARRLTFDGLLKSPPAWSPDGAELVYSAAEPAAPELVILRIAGGRPVRTGVSGLAPTWSPDGRRLAFVTDRGLHVVGRDGNGVRKVADPVVFRYAWSPDGSRLTFSRRGDIYVARADGGGERRLTRASARGLSDAAPAWSPGGGRIAFERSAAGRQPFVYTANADGTCEAPLVRGVAAWAPAWQPLPGSRAMARRRCADLSVTARTTTPRGRLTIRVNVLNDGTERLTGVTVRALRSTDASVVRAATTMGDCTARVPVRCVLGRLAPGASAAVVFTAEARRVTPPDDPREAEPIGIAVFAAANERDSRPDDNAVALRFVLASCSIRSFGGGLVLGTARRDILCGRRGRDRILGGDGDDMIRPGAGRDLVRGGAGRDVVLARDGEADRVSCGPDRDRVYADRRDVVARTCESVLRR